MEKLVLIDAHALIHRAFHALPPLTSPKGGPTNAVYGFTTILLKMIGSIRPEYIAAAFDLAGPTFRHEKFEQYKAHRAKAPDELYAQIPHVRSVLEALGVPVYEQQGYEADDVIGSVAERTRTNKDLQTIIATGDLDTLQLIEKNRVIVTTLRKGIGDTIVYNEGAVRERYGIGPSQMPDFKGLKGDPSDNIPGVPGIGEKTAASLIASFKSLEKLYAALDRSETPPAGVTPKLREKLLAHREQAFDSRDLATIVRDVDLSFSLDDARWTDHMDAEKLTRLCRDLGFHTLVKRLDTLLAKAAPEAPRLGLTESLGPAGTAIDDLAGLPDGDTAAVEITVRDGVLEAIHVATGPGSLVHLENDPLSLLEGVLNRYRTIVGHDLKGLLKYVPGDLPDTGSWFDTKIAAWLISPELRGFELDRVAYDTLQESVGEEASAWPPLYLRLREAQTARLTDLGLEELFGNLEMPLIAVLARMERNGIAVDPALLKLLSRQATKELNALQKKIHRLAGEDFNINSPQQLGTVLFERMNIRGKVKRTSTGALSTAAEELEKLRDEHPIIELILQWRELSKLTGTYIEPFPTLIADDGRVHTTYNQTGTATGRLSSQDPNLQNIPTKTELGQRFRSAFVAEKGNELLSLDYSQLELRLVAHIADDAVMREAFERGEDIHTKTASVVFGVPSENVSPQQRRQAKVLNFGIIYGMGSVGFARAAGISRDEARAFMDEYFSRFAGVAAYMERTKEQAARDGYVKTLMGRRRPLPEISSGMPHIAAGAERMAINHPVQGTGADIMKRAMLAVDAAIRTRYPDTRLLLQVHDELVLEVPKGLVAEVGSTTRTLMEEAYELTVPLIVDVKYGMNWSDMKPLRR